MIRRATEGDAGAMMAIYNQAVDDRVYANCDRQTDVDEFRQQYFGNGCQYAVFLSELHGKARGWGALKPFTIRPYDARMAEVALYIDRDSRSMGFGIRILKSLMRHAEAAHLHSLMAVVARMNTGSVRCGQFCGFEQVALLPGAATLLGNAEDMIWMQKIMSRREAAAGTRSHQRGTRHAHAAGGSLPMAAVAGIGPSEPGSTGVTWLAGDE